MSQEPKTPTIKRSARRRRTRNAVIKTPKGPVAYPTRGRIKANLRKRRKRLRLIASGYERCAERLRAEVGPRMDRTKKIEVARKAKLKK